eukprot:g882.t1
MLSRRKLSKQRYDAMMEDARLKLEPTFKSVMAKYGFPPPFCQEDTNQFSTKGKHFYLDTDKAFTSLVRIVIGQQLHNLAAKKIMTRFQEKLGEQKIVQPSKISSSSAVTPLKTKKRKRIDDEKFEEFRSLSRMKMNTGEQKKMNTGEQKKMNTGEQKIIQPHYFLSKISSSEKFEEFRSHVGLSRMKMNTVVRLAKEFLDGESGNLRSLFLPVHFLRLSIIGTMQATQANTKKCHGSGLKSTTPPFL